MPSKSRRRNRAVGVAGASLVLSTGLFGAYLGNPRMPRAYASVPCGSVNDQATLDTAVAAFNAGGCDTIEVTGDFTLSSQTPTFINASSLTIHGNGHTITTGAFPLHFYSIPSVSHTIQDATFTGGTKYALYETFGDLTLSHVTVTGTHTTASTPGVAAAIRVTFGSLHADHSTFSNNISDGSAANGGAIYALLRASDVVEISNSTFTGNQSKGTLNAADGRGGALYVKNFIGGGAVSITDSTFSQNSVDSNSYTGLGGAIYTIGTGGTLSVSGSTFTGNTALGGRGGAIFTSWDTTVTNSTFTSNSTGPAGAGGGAIASWYRNPALTVQFSTFSDNTAGYAASIDGAQGNPVSLVGDVFSGNHINNKDVAGLLPLHAISNSYFHSSADISNYAPPYNITYLDSTNVLGVAGGHDGSATVVGSANLGVLGSNGGSTQTMLPGAGSPLIGRGGNPGAFTLDQRGTTRLNPTTIGAVQAAVSSYVITYDGNGSTSGSVPSTTTGSGSVTLRSNSGSLARTGYTFAGWNTLANGTGSSYAAGAAYTLSASVTLYAQWTANGGGGGGGGGGSSTDSSTTSTPVVVRRPVVAAVPLGTSSLPTGGVTPGSAFLLVDGVPRAVTVKPDAPVTSQAKGLVATGDGFTLRMSGLDAVGAPLGVTGDAALVLERDHSVQVQGSGFDPNSDVQVYVFSQARLLGTVHTDATGAFSGLVQVPGDLELGHHTLQVDALDAGGSVRSLSLGVVLEAPQVAASQKTARASVEFAAGSTRLTSKAKSQLTALARSVGGKVSAGMVVGYVQNDGNYAKNQKLSAQRALAVAQFLHSQGIKATLVTRGNGALSANETARKAVVTLRYTA